MVVATEEGAKAGSEQRGWGHPPGGFDQAGAGLDEAQVGQGGLASPQVLQQAGAREA